MRKHSTACTRRRLKPAGWVAILVLAGLTLGAAGCTTEVGPVPVPRKLIPSYDDTIGCYADVPVDQFVLLRGYGLVVMPTPTGSRECPPGIRKIIEGELNRLRVGESDSVLRGLKISEWTNSLNTAAVEVRGLMPAGALKNDTFDVLVTALPGSQTTSLEGGRLVVTDLSVWRRGASGSLIHGKTLAIAAGPIFINPFADKPKPRELLIDSPWAASRPETAAPPAPIGTPADFRRGWVLGGALVLKDQPLQLVLREPDFGHASIAMDQVNYRFPTPSYINGEPTFLNGVAHATSPNLIELKVPPEYRRQVNFFLALVRQVYLRREPGFLEQRCAALAGELADPAINDSQRLRAAVTFAAIGKTCLPVLQPLYTHDNPAVAFHAVYAGLRIGDPLAFHHMLALIKDKENPFRLQAVLALGQPHPFVNIAAQLAPLLDEENMEIRIEAYRSITQLAARSGVSAGITSYQVGLGPLGFRLDVVRCQGPYMIHVARAEDPKIVLFGGDTMRISGPIFLHSDRTGATLSAMPGQDKVTLMRTNPATDALLVVRTDRVPVLGPDGKQMMDPGTKQPLVRMVPVTDMQTSFLVADVVRKLGGTMAKDDDNGELIGFGLDYSQVVHVLYQLTKSDLIPPQVRVHLEPLHSVHTQLANETPTAPTGDTIATVPEDHPKAPSNGGASSSQPDENTIILEKPEGGPPKIGN